MKQKLCNLLADETHHDLIQYSLLMVLIASGSFMSGRWWECYRYLGHL